MPTKKTNTPSTTTAPKTLKTTSPKALPVFARLTTPKKEGPDTEGRIRILPPGPSLVWVLARERGPYAGAKLVVECYKFEDEAKAEANEVAFAALVGVVPPTWEDDGETLVLHTVPTDLRTPLAAFQELHGDADFKLKCLRDAEKAFSQIDHDDLPETLQRFQDRNGRVSGLLENAADELASMMNPTGEVWDADFGARLKASRLRWADFTTTNTLGEKATPPEVA